MNPKTNRRGLITLLGLALAIGIGTLALQSILRAQGAPADSLQGTWLVTVSRHDGSTFLELVTCTGSGEVLEENNTPRIRSLGHGEWVKTGDRQFTLTFTFFRFDDATTRNFTFFRSETEKVQLESPDVFSSERTIQDFDTNGKLTAQDTATAVGKRLTVASPQP